MEITPGSVFQGIRISLTSEYDRGAVSSWGGRQTEIATWHLMVFVCGLNKKSPRRGGQYEGSALSFRSYGPGRYLAGQEGFEPKPLLWYKLRPDSIL